RLRLLRYAPGADAPRDHPRSRRTGRQPVAHRHPVVRRARGLPAVGPLAAAVPRQASRGSGGPAGAARPDRRDPLVAGGDPGRAPRARPAPPLRRRAPRERSRGGEAVNPFERTLLNVSTGLVALTGAVYFCMKYLMTGDDPFSVVHHPLQPHALSLHVLLAPVLVFALGLITREHIIGYLLEARQRRGRATGIVAVSLAA